MLKRYRVCNRIAHLLAGQVFVLAAVGSRSRISPYGKYVRGRLSRGGRRELHGVSRIQRRVRVAWVRHDDREVLGRLYVQCLRDVREIGVCYGKGECV